jgi:hypothetical protein
MTFATFRCVKATTVARCKRNWKALLAFRSQSAASFAAAVGGDASVSVAADSSSGGTGGGGGLPPLPPPALPPRPPGLGGGPRPLPPRRGDNKRESQLQHPPPVLTAPIPYRHSRRLTPRVVTDAMQLQEWTAQVLEADLGRLFTYKEGEGSTRDAAWAAADGMYHSCA